MKKLAIFILLGTLLISNNASALELTGGNALELKSGTVTTGNGKINATKSHNDLIFQVNANFVYQLDFDYSDTAIPANDYLLTFSVTYKSVYGVAGGSNYTGHYRYDGLQSETMNKLSESCIANDETPVTTQGNGGVPVWYGEGQLTCSYLFFSHAGYDSFSSHQDSRIWYTETNGPGSQIIVTPGFVRGISFNGLTDDDRTWLEEHMPEGSSTSDIESAIESAREDEKKEYEEQQEDVDSGADEAGEEAEEATNTLIETGRTIIETIRDTPATNCVIRIRSGAFDTGNLNLCNVPQQIRTVISTIITIPVTLAALHIAYSVVMLYLNTVRKEQE